MCLRKLKAKIHDKIYTSPQEPQWSRVLHTLYESENRYHEVAVDWKSLKNSDLEDELDLDGDELQESISYLLDIGLIEYTPPEMKPESDEPKELLRLTEKGFDIAHQRSIKKGETLGNAAIIYLTLIIAVSEAFGLLGQSLPELRGVIALGLLLLTAIVFHILIKDAENLGGGAFGMYT